MSLPAVSATTPIVTPTNSGKVLPHVSASQVETFSDCERKWFFSGVLGIKQPPSKSQELGTALHLELENYFTKKIIPASSLARKALQHLPDPDPALLVEHEFRVQTYDDGPLWLGYIDLVDPRDKKLITVYDHKSTSDPRYAKTPHELARTVQMNTYAVWAANRFQVADDRPIKVQHTYMVTRGAAAAMPVTALIPAPLALENWTRDMERVKKMVSYAASAKTVDEVTPNAAACGKFGGCPYRDRCGLPERSPFMALNMRSTLAPNPATPVNGVVNIPGAPKTTGAKLRDRLPPPGAAVAPTSPPAAPAPKPAPAPTPPPAATGAPVEDQAKIDKLRRVGRPSILPPDAPAPQRGFGAQAVHGVPLADMEAAGMCEPVAETPPVAAAPAAPAVEAPKPVRGPGRPRKAAPAAPEAPAPVTSTPATPTVDTNAAATPQATPAVAPLEIYVDCTPQKPTPSGITMFEDWMRPYAIAANERSQHMFKVPDWRVVEFGKGKGLLAAAVLQDLVVPAGPFYVDTRLSGADVALEVLIPYAARVVRGR